MKTYKHSKLFASNSGFTRVELIVVVVISIILAVMTTACSRRSTQQQRRDCVNNLKQIGIATRIYATDNQDRFPWQVSEVEGGSAEYIAASKAAEYWKHWVALSNELSNPKVVRCPSDRNRNQAKTFGETEFGGPTGNLSMSYFLGKGADESKPNNILSGDRNIVYGDYNNDDDNEGTHQKFGKKFSSKLRPAWTESLHRVQGDLLLSDSSCQQTSSTRLAQYMIDSSDDDNELMFPRGK